jgi:hypothetical protein
MQFENLTPFKAPLPDILDVVERLRTISGFSETQWLDLLGLSWKEYGMIRAGLRPLPLASLENLARHFDCTLEQIQSGHIDFRSIQNQNDEGFWEMPEQYTKATFGRRRTTITSFEFLERKFGWRLRFETLKRLGMSELALENEFAPVSMRFITDVCSHLATRQFKPRDFYEMGLYSYVGNRKTLLGDAFQQFSTAREVLEHMWIDLLPLYEQNCHYRFLRLTDTEAHLQVTSDPHVAAEMGVVHLGNKHICSLKAGMMASAPCYIGLDEAVVHETACVHSGDDACLFEIHYDDAHKPIPQEA